MNKEKFIISKIIQKKFITFEWNIIFNIKTWLLNYQNKKINKKQKVWLDYFLFTRKKYFPNIFF